MYNNDGGSQLANYIASAHSTIFGDLKLGGVLQMDY